MVMFQKSSTSLYLNFFLFICLLFLSPKSNALTTQQASPQVKFMRWTVGDTVREAMVHIPTTAKTKATPIIFVFHGHGGTMGNMYRSRGFEKLWPTDPQGKLPGWQKTPGDMQDRDLHFFDAMLKTFQQDYQVDDKRIYATGHSNGGGFTYLLWATRANIFAAFAPSAAVGGRIVNLLKPKPAMHIMGEQDPLVKPEWQRAMCERILKIDNCDSQGASYAQFATLYASKTATPVVLYIHPRGHIYPQEANEVVIKFFKSVARP